RPEGAARPTGRPGRPWERSRRPGRTWPTRRTSIRGSCSSACSCGSRPSPPPEPLLLEPSRSRSRVLHTPRRAWRGEEKSRRQGEEEENMRRTFVIGAVLVAIAAGVLIGVASYHAGVTNGVDQVSHGGR